MQWNSLLFVFILATGLFLYLVYALVSIDNNDVRYSQPDMLQENLSRYMDRSNGSILKNSSNDRIVILLWTKYFGHTNWGTWKALGEYPFTLNNLTNYKPFCNGGKCHVTVDKHMITRAHVVAFNCRDPVRERELLINGRQRDQLFVLFCHESPSHSNLAVFDAIGMNATSVYRRDSDFPYLWGKLVKRPRSIKYEPRTPWANRNRSVLWLVSNCGPASKRNVYVKELSKYIDVDIFGACGKKRCGPDCYRRSIEEYKFYLAFENSLCRDYITEKFWKALSTDMVPVTLGPAEYSHLVPNTSYIDTRRFASPRELASFLKGVAANQSAYRQHVAWKDEFYVQLMGMEYPMDAMSEAMARGGVHLPVRPIQHWWTRGACDNSLVNTWRESW